MNAKTRRKFKLNESIVKTLSLFGRVECGTVSECDDEDDDDDEIKYEKRATLLRIISLSENVDEYMNSNLFVKYHQSDVLGSFITSAFNVCSCRSR